MINDAIQQLGEWFYDERNVDDLQRFAASIAPYEGDEVVHGTYNNAYFYLVNHDKPIISLSNLIHRIAINLAVDYQKRRMNVLSRQNSVVDTLYGRSCSSPLDIMVEAEEDLERENLSKAVQEEVDRLPTTQREAMRLRYFKGKPYSEIGLLLGIEEGSARMSVSRGRLNLKEAIASRLQNPQYPLELAS